MGQNKEQLNKLLDFIAELAKDKDNAWFVKELGNRYSNGVLPQISRIEKYLALDYVLDSSDSTIDYTFINDGSIRNQLVSDNREMMRFRYGVRGHKIDFDEFCRFAHLQAEMLVNYYYKTTYLDFQSAKQIISQYNRNIRISDDYPEIESIAYGYKLKAIISELYPPAPNSSSWFSIEGQGFYSSLNNIKDVRNSQSHRGQIIDFEAFVSKYECDAKDAGLPWEETKKDINWPSLRRSPELTAVYESRFKDNHDKYKFYRWYILKPFDEIVATIKSLSIRIRNSIVYKIQQL